MIRGYLILTSCCDSFLWCICAEHSDLFRFPFGLSHLFLYWWWLPVAHVHDSLFVFCFTPWYVYMAGNPLLTVVLSLMASLHDIYVYHCLLLLDLSLRSIYVCHCSVTAWLLSMTFKLDSGIVTDVPLSPWNFVIALLLLGFCHDIYAWQWPWYWWVSLHDTHVCHYSVNFLPSRHDMYVYVLYSIFVWPHFMAYICMAGTLFLFNFVPWHTYDLGSISDWLYLMAYIHGSSWHIYMTETLILFNFM